MTLRSSQISIVEFIQIILCRIKIETKNDPKATILLHIPNKVVNINFRWLRKTSIYEFYLIFGAKDHRLAPRMVIIKV